MKKLNKKGFTIVELVIVIAVIAILAAVLIPTFATVITKANQSAALQKARNTYTEYVAALGKEIKGPQNLIIKGADNMFFAVVNGEMSNTVYTAVGAAGSTAATDATIAFTNENTLTEVTTVDDVDFTGLITIVNFPAA